MYKKLLNWRSSKQAEAKDATNYTQIPKEQLQSDCCCCCCAWCDSNSNSSSNSTCCQPTLCPLCTASLVLPSCVGAIRALQSSFVATGVQGENATCTPKNCCTNSEGNWMPVGDSMTAQRLHVMANTTRRCCSC